MTVMKPGLFSLFLLAACAYTPSVDLTPAQFMAIAKPQPLPADPRQVTSIFELDPAFPRPGYTYASGAPGLGHGIQVEYFSPDGEVYLWYPGNTVAVYGQYRVFGHAPQGKLPTSLGRVSGLKFKYQANSFNPLTKESGGRWEERDRNYAAGNVISYAQGDIFNLSSGKVPYPRRGCDLPAPMRAKPRAARPFC